MRKFSCFLTLAVLMAAMVAAGGATSASAEEQKQKVIYSDEAVSTRTNRISGCIQMLANTQGVSYNYADLLNHQEFDWTYVYVSAELYNLCAEKTILRVDGFLSNFLVEVDERRLGHGRLYAYGVIREEISNTNVPVYVSLEIESLTREAKEVNSYRVTGFGDDSSSEQVTRKRYGKLQGAIWIGDLQVTDFDVAEVSKKAWKYNFTPGEDIPPATD